MPSTAAPTPIAPARTAPAGGPPVPTVRTRAPGASGSGWSTQATQALRATRRATLLAAACALGLLQADAALAQSGALVGPANAELQAIYLNHLRNEGFQPEPMDATTLRFKREGRTFLLNYSESDPGYVVLRVIFRIDDAKPEDRLRALEAANASNLSLKVVKVMFVEPNSLTFHYETVQPTPQDAARSLTRAFGTLDAAVRRTFARLQPAT